MKYINATGMLLYTYVNGKLKAIKPGQVVEVQGYKAPPELTPLEDMNAIRRRQLQRAETLAAQRAAKAAPVEEKVEEPVVEEPVVEEAPKPQRHEPHNLKRCWKIHRNRGCGVRLVWQDSS